MAFDKNIVRAAARGRWREIFSALAPSLSEALERPGRHVACPVHGGTNGFRLFADFAETGGGVCNTCGARTDGFSMLMWVNGWSFSETINAVARVLGLSGSPRHFEAVKGESARGRLLFAGTATFSAGQRAFCVRLKTEDGEVVRFWGSDLKRALADAAAAVGDNVRVSLVGRAVTSSGRRMNVYSVHKLESDEARQKRLEAERLENERRSARIETLWRLGRPVTGTPVEKYLVSRGIPAAVFGALADLRWCPANPVAGGGFGMMLCAVRDAAGRLVNLHRTYLTDEGRKAPVAAPKRVMKMPSGTTINGAAIRLGEPRGALLAVAEGVETALSVTAATGIACWSAISAQGIEHFDVPASVSVLLVFADKDASGTGDKAARALAQRLAQSGGAVGIVILPHQSIPEGAKGIDFNDVLRSEGSAGFDLRACFQ